MRISISILSFRIATALVLLLGLGNCGQDPSFVDVPKDGENGRGGTGDNGQPPNGDQVADPASVNPGGGSGKPGENNNPGAGGNPVGGSTGGQGGNTPGSTYQVPAAAPDDLAALHKCLSRWKDLPFSKTITNYKKIYAAVTVGGFGNAINETERTKDPELVLIAAAVNVGGQTNYNLLNPNGYYCMKVGVEVKNDLTINLHCNARLADNKVSVNVGSNVEDNFATVGVSVMSTVNINTISPAGDKCIR